MERDLNEGRFKVIYPASVPRYAVDRSAAKIASVSGQTIEYHIQGQTTVYQIGGQRTIHEIGGQTLEMTLETAKASFPKQHAKFYRSK